MAISQLAGRPMRIIAHETPDEMEVLIVRFDDANWVFCLKPDPGLSYAIDPTGRQHEAYDPFDGTPPGIPTTLWQALNAYLEATYG